MNLWDFRHSEPSPPFPPSAAAPPPVVPAATLAASSDAVAGVWGPLLAMPFSGGFNLHDYQQEDTIETLRAWAAGYRGVVLKEGTGLGKSVLVSELARRLTKLGRVLVVVDVSNLADDLARTCYKHLGGGVGTLTGSIKDGWRTSRVVVATAQTLYHGGPGNEWFRQLNPAAFAGVLCDECETSIAERYSSIIRYFLDGNPKLVAAGLSATPRRGDGKGMGELYDYARQEAGPLNRDIVWGRDNGWTLHPRQAFVRVSVDFSTLKLKEGDDGVKDYTDKGILQLFEDERPLVELAKGIHEAAAERPAIVICPNSTDFAEALSRWLDSQRRGCSEAVHGKQGKRADDLMAAYKRGDFPYLVSVNKLYKGFDADRVEWVCMVRKTKSPRLYEQAMGRGVRPLMSIRPALYSAPGAAARRGVIAASPKPFMVMADLVGVDECAKDMGVIDILAGDASAQVRERAKKKLIKGEADAEKAAREAAEEIAAEAKAREEAEKAKRRQVEVQARVEVEYSDDLKASGGNAGPAFAAGANHVRQLRRFGVDDRDIARMAPAMAKKLAAELYARNISRLATWKQCHFLKRRGYAKGQLHGMSKDVATSIIEGIKGGRAA